MMESTLFAFDCDLTLTEADTDFAVAELGDPLPQEIKNLCDGHYWTGYMNAVYSYLHRQGVGLDLIAERINSIPLIKGILQLVTALHKKSQTQLVIVSDANNFAISRIMTRILEKSGSEVPLLCNKANVTEEGYLEVTPFQTQWVCPFCPQNLCKGSALEEFIMKRGPFKQIVYVGDGKNDICPVIRLTKNDIIFARKGFALERIINEGESRGRKVNVEAEVIYWEDGFDILNHLLSSTQNNN